LSSAKSGGWLHNLCWDPKGNGVFGIHYTLSRLSLQLAFLSYPGGSLQEIASDLSEYVGISLTANAKIIAATEMDRNSNFEEVTLKSPTRIQEHQVEGLLWFTPLPGTPS